MAVRDFNMRGVRERIKLWHLSALILFGLLVLWRLRNTHMLTSHTKEETFPETRFPFRPLPSDSIALVTCYAGSAAYLRTLTWPNKVSYAKKHKISIIDATSMYKQYSNELSALASPSPQLDANDVKELQSTLQLFAKLKIFQQVLHKYEWIVWTDADAIFLNFSRSIRDYIDPSYDVIIPAAPPHSARWRFTFNTGQLILRNKPWVHALLQVAWDLRGATCDPAINHSVVYNDWFTVCLQERCCLLGEQSALMVAMARCSDCRRRTKLVGFRDFNTFFPFWGEVCVFVN